MSLPEIAKGAVRPLCCDRHRDYYNWGGGVVLVGGGVAFVPESGVVVDGLLDGGVIVELGFVLELGTVLGVFGPALGELGAALGVFGAALGLLSGVLGVTSGVAPGSVGMVEELGLLAAGGFVVPGVVLCELCDPSVL